jgi:hypothetical protein
VEIWGHRWRRISGDTLFCSVERCMLICGCLLGCLYLSVLVALPWVSGRLFTRQGNRDSVFLEASKLAVYVASE